MFKKSLETIICDAVSIPIVAISGINRHNILELKGMGIDGVAVISATFTEKYNRRKQRIARAI